MIVAQRESQLCVLVPQSMPQSTERTLTLMANSYVRSSPESTTPREESGASIDCWSRSCSARATLAAMPGVFLKREVLQRAGAQSSMPTRKDRAKIRPRGANARTQSLPSRQSFTGLRGSVFEHHRLHRRRLDGRAPLQFLCTRPTSGDISGYLPYYEKPRVRGVQGGS